MQKLVEFSRRYGSNPELVLAGGGNTSMKEGGILYIKGSGCSLSTIRSVDFVAMDMEKLKKDLAEIGCSMEESGRILPAPRYGQACNLPHTAEGSVSRFR